MEIHAVQADNGAYSLTLSGAPAGAVVEVRFQNTMNGVTEVNTVTADGSGSTTFSAPRHFGTNFAVSARVLDSKAGVVEFSLGPDATLQNMRFVQSEALHAPAHAAPAQPAPAPH